MQKEKIIQIAILFLFTNIGFSQINGKILMDSLVLPGATIQLNQGGNIVQTDFYGNFSLPIKSNLKKDDLVIILMDLKLEIKNVELVNNEINMGNIHVPYFKTISNTEYEQLKNSEKENHTAVYCYTELLGYCNQNELEYNFLSINCEEKITDFEYNPTNKTITVDWKQIRKCK